LKRPAVLVSAPTTVPSVVVVVVLVVVVVVLVVVVVVATGKHPGGSASHTACAHSLPWNFFSSSVITSVPVQCMQKREPPGPNCTDACTVFCGKSSASVIVTLERIFTSSLPSEICAWFLVSGFLYFPPLPLSSQSSLSAVST